MNSADWSWDKFKRHYFSGKKRVGTPPKLRKSIQRTVDLLLDTQEESSAGDPSSPNTLNQERWRLPSASSFSKVEEILKRPTPHLQPQDCSSSSEAPGIGWFPSQLPEDPTIRDRFISPKPMSDPQHGSSETPDGPSGPPGTEDSAEDSETGYWVPDDSMGMPGYHYYRDDDPCGPYYER